MTLNTFHYAAVGAKDVTLCMPWFRKIINVSRKTKCPLLSVYLQLEGDKTNEKAKMCDSTFGVQATEVS